MNTKAPPTHIDDPRLLFLRSYRRGGATVYIYATKDLPLDECPFCQDGTCVQRVERCETWAGDLVVHEQGN